MAALACFMCLLIGMLAGASYWYLYGYPPSVSVESAISGGRINIPASGRRLSLVGGACKQPPGGIICYILGRRGENLESSDGNRP